jgi:hypothetical protein
MGARSASGAVERELLRMLKSLAHPDAGRIFSACARGLDASADEGNRLGMSRKRYYSRLHGLVESGLVQKVERRYEQTALGKLVFESLWTRELPAGASVAA